MKKLATFLAAAGIILPMTYYTAQAAPAKAQTAAKKKATVRKSAKTSIRKNQAKAPASLSTEGMIADRYHCEMGKSFTLYRYPDNKNAVILDWAGTKQQMHRVQTRTGSERFETNSKLTYIGVTNLTQLIDFQRGKPVLTECRNAEQKQVQAELDRKKAEAKTQTAQQKQETKKKKKSFWPF
ncbi:MAG: hypothetical protein ACI4NO_05425 [Oxalobacter sp.]